MGADSDVRVGLRLPEQRGTRAAEKEKDGGHPIGFSGLNQSASVRAGEMDRRRWKAGKQPPYFAPGGASIGRLLVLFEKCPKIGDGFAA